MNAVALNSTYSKALALIWHRALTWYFSPARPFAAPDDPLLVAGQQGSPFPACRQLSRARNACAGSSSEESTKLKHGTKLGPTLCYSLRSESATSSKPVVNDSKAILKCIISRKQKACSCTSSTTGAAYAASGAWHAEGRASHALCLAGSPMGSLVTCVEYVCVSLFE